MRLEQLDGLPVADADWDVGIQEVLALPYYPAYQQRGPRSPAERRANEVASCEELVREIGHVIPPLDGRVEKPLNRPSRQLERRVRPERNRSGCQQQDEHGDAEVRRRLEAVADRNAAQNRRQCNTGSASAVAIWRSVDAPNAAAASPVSTPALRSIDDEKAAAVTPPPGRTRPPWA